MGRHLKNNIHPITNESIVLRYYVPSVLLTMQLWVPGVQGIRFTISPVLGLHTYHLSTLLMSVDGTAWWRGSALRDRYMIALDADGDMISRCERIVGVFCFFGGGRNGRAGAEDGAFEALLLLLLKATCDGTTTFDPARLLDDV